MTRFGDFAPLCSHVPSYPWCNLFYRQLQKHAPTVLLGNSSDPKTAPVGVNPDCGILKVGASGSIGNVANTIVSALSIVVVAFLILSTTKRKAAVGRLELRVFLSVYLVSLLLQLLTLGSFLSQGTTALVVLTAIHAGIVAALFWTLLANALIATQVVEDGTPSSLVPLAFFTVALFAATTYISLDVALSISTAFGPSNPPDALRSIPVFVLTSVWPACAAVLYFVVLAYVVVAQLREARPMWFFLLAAALFVLSQLAYFLLGKIVCKGSHAKIDGSFIATILETASVALLYHGWKSITEDEWDDRHYPS